MSLFVWAVVLWFWIEAFIRFCQLFDGDGDAQEDVIMLVAFAGMALWGGHVL